MMTAAEARMILITYKMPLTAEQMVRYKQAMQVALRFIWGVV